MTTLESLFDAMSDDEMSEVLFIVFVAETDFDFVDNVTETVTIESILGQRHIRLKKHCSSKKPKLF